MRRQERDEVFRAARETDDEGVATLHAESWRANYRGILSDDYLDGPIAAERRQVWANAWRTREPARS